MTKEKMRSLERKATEIAKDAAEQERLAQKSSKDAVAQEQRASMLSSSNVGKGASGVGCMGGFCALFHMGACPFADGRCPRGQHAEPAVPTQDAVFVRITRAKCQMLQQKWNEAGGTGQLVGAWQVRNPRLDVLFRAAECDFAAALGHSSDVIDGWHGSAECNILSIAVNGFDPKRRSGQIHGAGEYFAKNPNVSLHIRRVGHSCSFASCCSARRGKTKTTHG